MGSLRRDQWLQAVPAVAQYCRIFRTESVFLYISNETACQRGFFLPAPRGKHNKKQGVSVAFKCPGGTTYSAERGSSLQRAFFFYLLTA